LAAYIYRESSVWLPAISMPSFSQRSSKSSLKDSSYSAEHESRAAEPARIRTSSGDTTILVGSEAGASQRESERESESESEKERERERERQIETSQHLISLALERRAKRGHGSSVRILESGVGGRVGREERQ